MKREHRLPTLTKATRLDQEALKVYSQNYLEHETYETLATLPEHLNNTNPI